jgi:hypothetical protein
MLPASVHCVVLKAFKDTINLKPLQPGGGWNFNPSFIEGLSWCTLNAVTMKSSD